jgi:ATP-dependent DNA helicase DinG
MATTHIAVDLETTGLDPTQDAIIEVGAITFRNGQILDEYSSLVNPDRTIPPFITDLTGINQSMVGSAPDIRDIKQDLNDLLEGKVVVGHNVGFDMGFLNAENIGYASHRVDTATLASILLPGEGRYGLASLTRNLGLRDPEDGQDHRALADAKRTTRLFITLQRLALKLDFSILEEIVRAGQQLRWLETVFFEDAFKEVGRQSFGRSGRLKKLFNPPESQGETLSPADLPDTIDVDVLSKMLEEGGSFDEVFPGYEYRPQQIEMMQAVAQAFNAGQHLLIEAGTGTGKSIGYLLPAAYWATTNQRRVVVSTNTINLQDQLLSKDLPELGRILPFKIRAAVLKGRRNYLCTRLFQQLRHRGPTNNDEMVLFARMLVWLPESNSGDLSEITLRKPGERIAWSRLNAENDACTREKCAQEECPLHMARRNAELAHILVVNHALLLADVSTDNRVLPEYTDLIMDEAHHMESAVTNGLSFHADRRYLEGMIDVITRSRGSLVTDLRRRMDQALPSEYASQLDGRVNGLETSSQAASAFLEDFFVGLSYFLNQFSSPSSQYAQQIRFTSGIRIQPEYDQVLILWDNLNLQLKAVSENLTKLASQIADISDVYEIEDGEDLRIALLSLARNFEETRTNINALISEPADSTIYWCEIFRNRLSLHVAPLHIGPLVEEHIFHKKETVVLTSATLRTAGSGYGSESNFDYLRSRLYAYEAEELAVGSPFDYPASTLVVVPTDMPEPNQPGYQRQVESAIADIVKAVNGRTLVLFTSYSQLNKTAQSIKPVLERAGIGLLTQTEGSSRQRLLEIFRSAENPAVLMGTRSFWEGVDVPGKSLQVVIIVKLPFDVPSDPIIAARSETYESPFFEYTIPEAVLRFRQGFGRLIRRQDDEGLVVVLDKRVLSKRYGQAFLDALPECTLLRQRLDRLGEIATRWLNRER